MVAHAGKQIVAKEPGKWCPRNLGGCPKNQADGAPGTWLMVPQEPDRGCPRNQADDAPGTRQMVPQEPGRWYPRNQADDAS